jgi:glutamate racemase
VIGTEATVASHAYARALAARGIQAEEKACPLLVPLIEEGWIEHPVTEQVARIYLDEVFSSGRDGGGNAADVLVLGCTHYPLIRPLLRRVTPAHVKIVDSAESTAQVVSSLLPLKPVAAGAERRLVSRQTFFATDSIAKFQRLGARFLGHAIDQVHPVDLRD